MLACLVASLLVAGAPRPPVRPFPSWADDLAIDPAKTPARLSLQRLLVDRELRVAKTVHRLTRVIRRVNTPEGVSVASRVDVSYDPSYQHLSFHRARIWRGGKAVDGLARAEFRSLQREAGLEDDLLDGHVSGILVLHDVRPGDVVDLAWSVDGDPTGVEKFSGIVEVRGDETNVRLRNRVLFPKDRPLQLRAIAGAPEPIVREAGAFREYVWDASPPPMIETEPQLPIWFDPTPRVQLSEFRSWNEVARWAAPMYRPDDRPPRGLAPLVHSLRNLPREQAADRVLRFVREQIRYFGLEMGSNAYRPHRPAAVFERRFGDCKDKALLLVTLLRAAGIEAEVALVNTRLRHELDRRLPAPYLFDHAIVHLRLDGTERWVDPTLTSQRGRLATLPALPYARALVLDERTQGLAKIPLDPAHAPLLEVHETWHARSLTGAANVEMVTTWTGSEADRERVAAANSSPEKIGYEFLEFYRRREPAIEKVHDPIVRDDPEEGTFRTNESYRVPAFWAAGKHSFVVDALVGKLEAPDGKRTMPLGLSFPMRARHVLRIELPPERWDITRFEEKLDAPGMHAELKRRFFVEPAGPVVLIEAELFTTSDSVSSTDVDVFRRKLEQLDDLTHRELRLPVRQTASVATSSPASEGGTQWALAAIGALLCVQLVRSRRRRGSARFAGRAAPGIGESAATALRVSSWSEVESFSASQRCACGRPGAEGAVSRAEPVVFRGAVMGVARAVCPCARIRVLYYDLTQ